MQPKGIADSTESLQKALTVSKRCLTEKTLVVFTSAAKQPQRTKLEALRTLEQVIALRLLEYSRDSRIFNMKIRNKEEGYRDRAYLPTDIDLLRKVI